jgi:ATP-dependent RNA helicase DOB1
MRWVSPTNSHPNITNNRHIQVAVPAGRSLDISLHESASPAALTAFPHRLDGYQNEAIACIENGRNLLISAHSSSGKSSIAKYLAYQVRESGRRMVYVTPYEKLAQRKYRELADEMGEVAYLAGDMDSVVGMGESCCVVMPVQALLARIYKQGGIGKVDWIVFDEAQALGYPGGSCLGVWGGGRDFLNF